MSRPWPLTVSIGNGRWQPTHSPVMAPAPVPHLFPGTWGPLAQPACGKFYAFRYPRRGQRERDSGRTGAPKVHDDGVDRVGRRAGGTNQLANDQGDGAAHQQEHEQGRIGHHFARGRCIGAPAGFFRMPATAGGDGLSCNCSSLTWPYQGPWPGLTGLSGPAALGLGPSLVDAMLPLQLYRGAGQPASPGPRFVAVN